MKTVTLILAVIISATASAQRVTKTISDKMISGVYAENIRITDERFDSTFVVLSFPDLEVKRRTEMVEIVFRTRAQVDTFAVKLHRAITLTDSSRMGIAYSFRQALYRIELDEYSKDIYVTTPNGVKYTILTRKEAERLIAYLRTVKF